MAHGREDFTALTNSDIISTYVPVRAVATSATITDWFTDAYSVALNWLTQNLGKKLLLIASLITGTETSNNTENDATSITAQPDGYVLFSTFTLTAEEYYIMSMKSITIDMSTSAGGILAVKWTVTKDGVEVTAKETTHTQAVSDVWETKTATISPAYIRQMDTDLIVKCYCKSNTAGLPISTKNRGFTYDKLLPQLTYEILTYAYEDGISYAEATGTLKATSARVIIDNVYAQVKVRLKCAETGCKVQGEVDYIGVSL